LQLQSHVDTSTFTGNLFWLVWRTDGGGGNEGFPRDGYHDVLQIKREGDIEYIDDCLYVPFARGTGWSTAGGGGIGHPYVPITRCINDTLGSGHLSGDVQLGHTRFAVCLVVPFFLE